MFESFSYCGLNSVPAKSNIVMYVSIASAIFQASGSMTELLAGMTPVNIQKAFVKRGLVSEGRIELPSAAGIGSRHPVR
jgi:hypothetical protein